MNRLSFSLLCVALALLAMRAEAGGTCKTPEGMIPAGQDFYTEHPCARNTCHADGSISAVGCASFVAPGCEIKKGKGKYPACCDHPVCKKN